MLKSRAALFALAVLCLPQEAWPQGNPIGLEFRVSTYTTGEQGRPSIASDAAGNFVVVWRSSLQDYGTFGIYAQRHNSSGAPLGAEFRVNTYTTQGQAGPSVAVDPAGNFVVAWVSTNQDGSSYGIFGQRYASSGSPLGPEFRVNTFTTGAQSRPAAGSDSAGNFVVVWGSAGQDGSDYGVFGQRYASSGAPLGPEFRVNTFTTGYQGLPNLVSDAAGNFVVAWISGGQDGSSYGVFAQRYASSGLPVGPEFRVNTHTTGGQIIFNHSMASDSSGNFVVTWQSQDQDGSDYGIFGQRYASSGIPLGPEFRVNTYTTGYQGLPSAAADTDGNFVVVWDSPQDGSGAGVFGQRYVSTGAPLGPEFLVNTYTTNNQIIPAVTSNLTHKFVVVWQGDLQDGSNFGVFGQRYGDILPVELMNFSID